MAANQQISLADEQLRVEEAWKGSAGRYVPLPLAAALAFHHIHGEGPERVALDEYSDALDIAASALARLLPVYTLDGAGQPLEVKVDFVGHRFVGGGAALRSAAGALVEPLSVQRTGILSAISFIRRVGLPYSFGIAPGVLKGAAPAKSERES